MPNFYQGTGLQFELSTNNDKDIEGDGLLWTCKMILPSVESLPAAIRFFFNGVKLCSLYLRKARFCEKTESSNKSVDCFCSNESNTTFYLNITLGHHHTGNWSCGDINKDGAVSSAIYLTVKNRQPFIISPNGGHTPTGTESSTWRVESTSTTAPTLSSTQVTQSPVPPSPSYNYYIYTGVIIG
ncbi:hypothetical protein LOTGIDRAFT_173969 [Lottia gigantea]|uniref:Uncharacterized protein n=1 Tax=Lottia gigantea TaxID=225164 RepID=V4APG4_LOTGI|nr:hypothetical protein LOTGIDRAFT_173969 [Lottia gigantea]ESO99087.1 hypothetical protein LOTGIDRAFT_173969 [Lottia gigantea]